jgi:hypothetical protein
MRSVRKLKREACPLKCWRHCESYHHPFFWVKIFHNKERGQNKIWQEGYHPVAIKSKTFFNEKLDYIHYNPVKKGFVEKPEHWKYSSARNYLLGDDSLIVIDKIEWSEVCRLKSV